MSIALINASGIVEQVDHSTNTPPVGWISVPSEIICGQITTDGKTFINPGISDAQKLMEFRESAKQALIDTQGTFERITEAILTGKVASSDATVQAWYSWRSSTRSCISASSIGTLPLKPTNSTGQVIYPAGT